MRRRFLQGLGDSTDYTQMIADAATQNGVDPNLAIEVGIAESNLNPAAISSAGAVGIMQLMPGTAAQYGADPTDPADNIQAGVSYLGDLLNQFGGNQVAALAAYNWGPGNVQKAMSTYGSNWLSHAPAETQNYVAKILGNVNTQYQTTSPIAAAVNAIPTAIAVPAPAAVAPPSGSTAYATILPPLLPAATTSTFPWIPVAIGGGIVLFLLLANG